MNVVITGMGAISSLGIGVEPMFQALLENRSGVKHIAEWEKYKGLFSHLGAPAPQYNIAAIPRTARRSMSRMSEMAVVATLEASQQAKLQHGGHRYTPRTVLCMGSTSGSPEQLEAQFKKLIEKGGPEGQLSTTTFKVMNHSVAANVACALEFYGPAIAPGAACATSAQAIALGWELLQSGLYDIVIAGGADELHYTTASVFDIVLAASRGYNDRPDIASRPFDARRDGLVVSEGAGIVILETEESAKRRGAAPLANVLSGFHTCDGVHMSQTQADSMGETMRCALERAKRSAGDVDYVSAHATSTVQGDQEEASAIGAVLGNGVPVSSLKGNFGHTLAACGALEVIASIKMMERSMVLPTRNLVDVDPACSGIRHVQAPFEARIRTVLSNNFGFGGMNATVILSRA